MYFEGFEVHSCTLDNVHTFVISIFTYIACKPTLLKFGAFLVFLLFTLCSYFILDNKQ